MKETEDILALKQYLLGRLELRKQEELEQRLLTDDAYLEDVSIAEDELIDEYLENKLSEEERDDFRRHFLSVPERREKLRFAKTLNKYIQSNPPLHSSSDTRNQRLSWFASTKLSLRGRNVSTAFSLAAALVLAVLVGFLLIRNFNRQGRIEPPPDQRANANQTLDSEANREAQRRLELEKQRREQLTAELQRAEQQRQDREAQTIARREKEKRSQSRNENTSARSFMTSVLALGGVRSETSGLQEVSIPKGAGVVKFPLRLDDDKYEYYRVTLITGSGQTLKTRNNLKPSQIDGQTVIVFSVPASAVSRGEFQLRLAGARDGRLVPLGRYAVRTTTTQ